MPNGGVSKNTFIESDPKTQMSILYDQQTEMIKMLNRLQNKDTNIENHCETRWHECDKRFKNIEKNWYKLAGIILFISLIAPTITAIISTSGG
jgi:hypothetical protein